MMLWLHCYNLGCTKDPAYQTSFLCSLINLSSRISSPVEIFIILSGYGIYSSFQKKHTLSLLKRIIKLLILYWISLLLFIPIRCYFQPAVYPGSISDVILNMLTLDTSYNYTTWFLFPYIITVITAQWIIPYFILKPKLTFFASGMLYVMFYIMLWIISSRFQQVPFFIKNILNTFTFFFLFFIGAAMYRYSIVELFSRKVGGGGIAY